MSITPLLAVVALTLVASGGSARSAANYADSRPDTVSGSSSPVPVPDPARRHAPLSADSIVVDKSEHRLSLFRRGTLVKSYLVALGQRPVGDKLRVGDMRTPEGLFHIAARNPQSRYHLALRISYPDAAHRARAQALGVSPGGDIMIHGLPDRYAAVGPAHREFDWTEGCIAVTNEEIEEIWAAVPVGTPIQIKP